MCPLCGAESKTTSVICSCHLAFIYNSYGKLMAFSTYNPLFHGTYWTWVSEGKRWDIDIANVADLLSGYS